MIAAIMQPYFFPYIGYFQLMKAVDVFVFYDDVQYMKGGWVNRNRIRVNDEPVWLTFPVERLGLASLINDRRYLIDETTIAKFSGVLEAAYAKAPGYQEVAPVVRSLLKFDNLNVAAFNANLLTALARTLDIRCRFLMASAVGKPANLKGKERVIDICRRLNATRYVNAIGGTDLYQPGDFERLGLQLSFLRTTAAPASFCGEPIHLSILDTLMCNGFAHTGEMMTQYELIAPPNLPVGA
jgi:hypothetical protein